MIKNIELEKNKFIKNIDLEPFKVNPDNKVNNSNNNITNTPNFFVCEKCDYSTNKPSCQLIHTNSKKHQNNIQGIEVQPKPKTEYHCDCCNITVYHLTNWNIHINSSKHKREGKPKSIECIECDRKFINHTTQRHHMLSVHSTKEERSKEKYYCDPCDLVFISKLYFDKHMEGKFHKIKVKALESFEEMKIKTIMK